MLYNFLIKLTIVKYIVVIILMDNMFRHGPGFSGETDDGNQRKADELRKVIRKTKALFELKASLYPISRLFKEKAPLDNERAEKRAQFIEATKEKLIEASKNNSRQVYDGPETSGETYIFDHYLSYFNREERTAQQGYNFKETVAFRMVESVSDDGEPYGDELFGHFILPIDFIAAANLNTLNVDEWLNNIDAVYLKIIYDQSKNLMPVEYLISNEGVTTYRPIFSAEEADRELEPIFDDDREIVEEIIRSDINEADIVAELFERLAKMRLFRFKTSTYLV
jgi:hypothetical protein